MTDSETAPQATLTLEVSQDPMTHNTTTTVGDVIEVRRDEENNHEPALSIDMNESIKGKGDLTENKEKDEEEEEKKASEKPLLEESVNIDIKFDKEEHPTLPLHDKKKKTADGNDTEKKQREKLPRYLFPFTRIKEAWNTSTNIFQFLGRAMCIIFQTVGWFTCVGGIPFLSLVMLIIGSIYVNDCIIEPNIPVYLIVSGVIGTMQHVITIWTKYVPKNSSGRLKVYRSYCHLLNGLFHLFLMIWFIMGCVWVYGAHSEVDFRDPEKDEYCNKTLYYFAFWVLNISFIFLALLVVLSACFLICAIVIPKQEEKIVQ